MKYLVFFLFLANFYVDASTIYVFGDSHSRELTGIPNVKVCYLGPVTMHRIGRDRLRFLNLKKMNVQEGDVAVFAFGEIDARVHIGKQRDEKQRDLDEIIQSLCLRYVETIVENRSLFQNLTCVVYSITPPTDMVYSAEYPRHGSLADRVDITRKFNQYLKYLCLQNGIKFLDVFDEFASNSGFLIPALSDGNVHIHCSHNHIIGRKLYALLSE